MNKKNILKKLKKIIRYRGSFEKNLNTFMKRSRKMVKRKFSRKKDTFSEVRYLYMLAGVVFFVSLLLALWFAWIHFSSNKNIEEDSIAIETIVEEDEEYVECIKSRKLDGVCMESVMVMNPQLVVVMMDNHTSARPQSGLNEASIIYEAPVEGNFTRYMLVLPKSAKVAEMGPVRSARPYFLEWTTEYGNPMYFHVGGSPEALAKIDRYDIFDFDEFSRGWYFWRKKTRRAPHNTYTSSELWNSAYDRYSEEEEDPDYDGWKFGKVEDCEQECTSNIEVVYNKPYYNPIWKYNSSTEKYERFQSALPYEDEKGVQVSADNIIVQVTRSTVLDDVGRIKLDTIGNGEAYIFTKGNIFKGNWNKKSRSARTKWLDADDEPIVLSPGQTWVQVVNQFNTVDWE